MSGEFVLAAGLFEAVAMPFSDHWARLTQDPREEDFARLPVGVSTPVRECFEPSPGQAEAIAAMRTLRVEVGYPKDSSGPLLLATVRNQTSLDIEALQFGLVVDLPNFVVPGTLTVNRPLGYAVSPVRDDEGLRVGENRSWVVAELPPSQSGRRPEVTSLNPRFSSLAVRLNGISIRLAELLPTLGSDQNRNFEYFADGLRIAIGQAPLVEVAGTSRQRSGQLDLR